MIDGRKRAARASQIIPCVLQRTKKQLQVIAPAFVHTYYLETCKSRHGSALNRGCCAYPPTSRLQSLQSVRISFLFLEGIAASRKCDSGPTSWPRPTSIAGRSHVPHVVERQDPHPLATMMQRISIALWSFSNPSVRVLLHRSGRTSYILDDVSPGAYDLAGRLPNKVSVKKY
jgi:hypothetical protein